MTIRNPKFPISNAGHLFPFIQLFKSTGVPFQKELHRQKIPSEIEFSAFLPTQSIFNFINNTASKEGIDNIGLRVTAGDSTKAVHPFLSKKISYATSLVSALQVAAQYCSLQGSHVKIWLEFHDNWLWICHKGSLESSTPGLEQFEYFRIMRFLELIRAYLGEKWMPPYLQLSSRVLPPPLFHEIFTDIKIKIHGAYGIIPISVRDLETHTINIGLDDILMPDTNEDWFARLLTVTPSYVGKAPLNVSFFSELLDLSPRTLQRMLADKGTSVREITNIARFEKARTLIINTDLPVKEIATHIGYADTSNFIRFFCRLSGCSPVQLRKNIGAK